MQIAIASIDALGAAVRDWQPEAVVSIHKPTVRMLPIGGARHLRLAFHDVESLSKNPKVMSCRTAHVEAFVHFIVAAPTERLLVQCTAGLSRSPAFAIIAMVQMGVTAEAACALVREAVPHASPNRLVLRVGDGVLKTGGAMTRAAAAFTFRRSAYGALGARAGFRVVGSNFLGSGNPPGTRRLRATPGYSQRSNLPRTHHHIERGPVDHVGKGRDDA